MVIWLPAPEQGLRNFGCGNICGQMFIRKNIYKPGNKIFVHTYSNRVHFFRADRILNQFWKSSKNIVIIGAQINVAGTMALQPSMILNQAEYLKNMSRLQVTNLRETSRFDNYFDHIAKEFDIAIIKPTAIFCADQCTIDDGSWSYFSDASHIGAAATDFVAHRLKRITADFDLNTTIVKQTPDRGKDND